MAVLGKALASHLVSVDGLYSVELPDDLADELLCLVSECNASSADRAMLVVNSESSPSGSHEITWPDLLSWRTDDNRVFAWQRGLKEPDSSFQSVVKPFISARFPGTGRTSHCTLEMLATLSMKELFKSHKHPHTGDTFDAFRGTATWLLEALRASFERFGSTPARHWSDRFLVHWAAILDALDTALLQFQGLLDPRHSWEIIRLSGLPVPRVFCEGSATPFTTAPKLDRIDTRQPAKFASWWQEVIDEYFTSGRVAPFMTALDGLFVPNGQVNPWRGFEWQSLDSAFAEQAPAPDVGFCVFARHTSPTMLLPQHPSYPAAPQPSWWGVTEVQIDQAVRELRGANPLRKQPTCDALIDIGPQSGQVFLLATREGTASFTTTNSRWRSELSLTAISMVFKDKWSELHVSITEPMNAVDGDVWVNPDNVNVSVSGCKKITTVTAASDATSQLVVEFDIVVNYSGTRNAITEQLTGKWNSSRKIELIVKCRDYLQGSWRGERVLTSSVPLIIPSPFQPTVICVAGNRGERRLSSPARDREFGVTQNEATEWTVDTTPELLLKESEQCELYSYDGQITQDSQFVSNRTIQFESQDLDPMLGHDGAFQKTVQLTDGDLVTVHDNGSSEEVTVIRVQQPTTNSTSGVVGAVRNQVGSPRPPSDAAVNSFLGKCQEQIAHGITSAAGNSFNSLYQYVVFSTEEATKWPEHTGMPSPVCVPESFEHLVPPGIGRGPSDKLVATSEWQDFTTAFSNISAGLELNQSAGTPWLSSIDPSRLSLADIQQYVKVHSSLVNAAKTLSPSDAFWASYPMSIVLIDGSPGETLGQLQAVFLSPLHPVRLAWGFSLAELGRHADSDPRLFGLVEGWNLPYTGTAVTPAMQPLPLIAVPIDPGPEQDFATWGALVVLGPSGLPKLPASANNLPLPWGGRTGINQTVTERAVRDYLAVHPHLNSIDVDIRSMSQSPRSVDVDDTILRCVGAGMIPEARLLGGGGRVWESRHREGTPPSRDKLFALRAESEYSAPFEWHRYPAADVPRNTDVALIENASVHLAITDGSSSGVVGSIPLRRFCPTTLTDHFLDQNYTASPGDDLLGLSTLLAAIEFSGSGLNAAVRAAPQAQALGVGQGARWEVLGTFNLDPSLVASIASTIGGNNDRVLWEWRPSWLNRGEKKQDDELVRRPYYVVAKVPASLRKSLQHYFAISTDRAMEVFTELGRRGIGITTIQAKAETQDKASLGFFYSLRFVLPAVGNKPIAGWTTESDEVISALLPLDPVESLLESLAGKRMGRRADLVAIQLRVESHGALKICFLPIEVKHHGDPTHAENIPANTNAELRRARKQLAATSEHLNTIAGLLNPQSNDRAATYGCYLRRLGIATLVELALGLSPTSLPAKRKEEILRTILNGKISVGVERPLLLWFAVGSHGFTGSPFVINPHGIVVEDGCGLTEFFVDPAALPGLWWQDEDFGDVERNARDRLDEIILTAFSDCRIGETEAVPDFDAILRAAISTHPAEEIVGVATNPPTAEIETNEFSPNNQEPGEAISDESNVTAMRPSAVEKNVDVEIATAPEAPRRAPPSGLVVGTREISDRWAVIGTLSGHKDIVSLDLDHPKAMGIFGYMGSGKSYLLGNLIESAATSLPNINSLDVPLSVVIFNYRRNASDRFELSSLAHPNESDDDIERLRSEYQAFPAALQDIHVMCLPGERGNRIEEYGPLTSSELFFDPSSLSVEDWELLMGEPGSDAVFARTIRHSLVELRNAGEVNYETLHEHVLDRLSGQSRSAAQLRFDFVKRYLSPTNGANFSRLLRPGRVTIIDLRQPLFNKEDALRFFLVCANQVSQVQGEFNKIVVFDEAHEYLSNEFGERIESRIRQMRHEGTSYIFATQDVGSIPKDIRRFITTRFVFGLGTQDNVDELVRYGQEFKGLNLMNADPGRCFIQSNDSIDDTFRRPRLVEIRPRVTQHGGRSRIYS